MIKKNLLLCLISCTFFTQCINEQNKQSVTSSILTIDVSDFSEKDTINLSDITDSVWYVPLETSKLSLIGRIDKMAFVGDTIYILDRFVGRSVFAFNNEGIFLFRIGSQGKGPGQFIEPVDIDIDYHRKQIAILDTRNLRVNVYSFSGEFIKEFPFKDVIMNMCLLDDESIAYNSLYSEKKNDWYYLKIQNNQIVNKYFSYTAESQITKHQFQPFLKSNNTVYVKPITNDTIYTIQGGAIHPQLAIDFGQKRQPYVNENNISDIMENSGSYCSIYWYHIMEDLVCFNFHYGPAPYYTFYNKKTNNIKAGILNNDITGLPAFIRFAYNNLLVSNLDPTIFHNEDINNPLLDSLKKDSKWISKLEDDSNPVIVFYKLKDNIL